MTLSNCKGSNDKSTRWGGCSTWTTNEMEAINAQRADGDNINTIIACAMDPLAGDPAAAAIAGLAACRPVAWKYCGGGFGGYAVYLFNARSDRDAACALPGFRPVEPYVGM
jgi:hypothetical protein